MERRRTFGRRNALQAPDMQPIPRPIPAMRDGMLRGPDPAEPSPPFVEDEVEAWKSQRRSFATFPWRQLSLMAGLSFGIASFALPKAVNDAVAWPLYGLTALAFCAGLAVRKI